MVIEFDETLADSEATSAFTFALPVYQRQFAAGLKKTRSSSLGYILACGLMTMGVGGLLLGGPRVPSHLFCFACGLLLGVFMYGKRFSRDWYAAYVRKHAQRQRRGDGRTWPQRLRIELRAEGVGMICPDYEIRAGWKYIWFVEETATHVHIVINSGQGVGIPLSTFPTPSAAHGFVRHAHELMERGGETPRQRLARYLVDSDLNCPSCKYTLRGVVAERCPECGRHLDLIELREIAQRATVARGPARG